MRAEVVSGNSGRERILARIRAGLRVSARENTPPDGESAVSVPGIFSPVSDRMERFQKECGANLIECSVTEDPAESALKLRQSFELLPAGEIFVQDDLALRRLMIDAAGPNHSQSAKHSIRWSSEGPPREISQATITLAEALIAQTGSILVSSRCGGRGASVVAPCHIVFATTEQMVDDLPVALRQASHQQLLEHNSFACVISGSSRTADIEKILVQGAHGPRRVVVIVQKN